MATSMQELEAALRDDEELAKKYQAALEAADEDDAINDIEAIVVAAKAAGFEVTAEEVEKGLAANIELSDEDLDEITGGYFSKPSNSSLWVDEKGRDTLCYFSWHCYTAILHAESEDQNSACWKSYGCIIDYRHYYCTTNDLH